MGPLCSGTVLLPPPPHRGPQRERGASGTLLSWAQHPLRVCLISHPLLMAGGSWQISWGTRENSDLG